MTDDVRYAIAVLSLFKALPETKPSDKKADNAENISYGFFLMDDAVKKCSVATNYEVLAFIRGKYGYDAVAMNRGLHRSFREVAETSEEKLFIQQMFHYVSVFLQNGDMTDSSAVDDGLVYVPASELSLPEDAEPVKVLVIGSITEEEVFSRIMDMLASGAALSEDTLSDIMTVLHVRHLEEKVDIGSVKNKEARVRLYSALGRVPGKAEEFLRFLVWKATGTSLLIRSRDLILAIKYSRLDAEPYFHAFLEQAGEDEGIEELSRVFLRHKNKAVFLAFKGKSEYVNHVLNRVRKLADKNKVAAKVGVLDRITSDPSLTADDVRKALKGVTTFKKVSVANSLLFHASNPKAAVYFVRNGKSFTKEIGEPFIMDSRKLSILNAVVDSVAEDVRPAVEGKKVFLPDDVDYAAPTSEKRFIGGVPFNTSFSLGKEVVIGVHWVNVDGERTDLDLHYNSAKYQYGWDTQFEHDEYRRDRVFLFSGDMTDAPAELGGATEAFWFGEGIKDDLGSIDLDNYTNWELSDGSSAVVPYKLVLGPADSGQIDKDYLVNCHKAKLNVQESITGPSDFLGFLEADEEGNKKFWFAKSRFGNTIVSRYDKNKEAVISATKTSFHSCLKLHDVLERAGAVFEKGEDEAWDIDLSLDKVTKDTFLSLFSKGKE